MDTSKQSLERLFDDFIDQEEPYGFFSGLATYLEYVLSEALLAKVFEDQLAERRALYEDIESTENEIRKELDDTKKKLIAVMRKRKLDVSTFERFATTQFYEGTDLIREISIYEGKDNDFGVGSATFTSEDLVRHFFDLASNIVGRGYEKDIKDFVVTPEEYAIDHSGFSSQFCLQLKGRRVCFVFSKTLPTLHEKIARFEQERAWKPWASFESLVQYRVAHKLALEHSLEGRSLPSEEEASIENVSWFGESKERIKIFGMALEIHRLGKNELDFHSRVAWPHFDNQEKLKYLIPDVFRGKAKSVHNLLLQSVSSSENSEKSKTRIHIDDKRGICTDTGNKYQITGKRLRFVLRLLDTDYLPASDMSDIWKSSSQITHEVSSINKIFRNKLGLESDLIYHSATARGYCFNREDYEIVPDLLS